MGVAWERGSAQPRLSAAQVEPSLGLELSETQLSRFLLVNDDWIRLRQVIDIRYNTENHCSDECFQVFNFKSKKHILTLQKIRLTICPFLRLCIAFRWCKFLNKATLSLLPPCCVGLFGALCSRPLRRFLYDIGSQSAARGPMAARRKIPGGPQWHTDVSKKKKDYYYYLFFIIISILIKKKIWREKSTLSSFQLNPFTFIRFNPTVHYFERMNLGFVI